MLNSHPESRSRTQPRRWGLQASMHFLMMAFTVPLLLCFSHAAKAQVAASKAAWMPPDPPAGFFIPIDLFSKPAGPGTSPPAAPPPPSWRQRQLVPAFLPWASGYQWFTYTHHRPLRLTLHRADWMPRPISGYGRSCFENTKFPSNPSTLLRA